jgi:RNA polymerase sigma-70 factor (ECF subfamily)
VHQSFLKLMKVIHKIDEPKCHKTRALVVTIVERTAIDLYRRRQKLETVSFDEEDVSAMSVSDTDAAATRLDLASAIAALPARYRQVLLLRYDSGFSCREIAGLLSMSEPNVRKTIQRAKEKLGELLEEGDETP